MSNQNVKEATIQKWVQDKLKKAFGEDIYIFKIPQGQYTSRRGIADLCMCIKGQYAAIEVKTDNGRLTALQDHEMSKVKRSGATAITIYGKDEGLLKAFIKQFK